MSNIMPLKADAEENRVDGDTIYIGDLRVLVTIFNAGNPPRFPHHIGFSVPDLDKMHTKFRELGVFRPCWAGTWEGKSDAKSIELLEKAIESRTPVILHNVTANKMFSRYCSFDSFSTETPVPE
ncbi:MAG: hypothetical protein OEY94_07970 [Alphaproteobacteria bacterium]|nr:hypothetical protein [Alphaproteobacteria bacterium]